MQNHLKSAVDRFNKINKKENLINPISEIDAEIIVEITEACKKINREDLVSILKNWKYSKDEQIRDALLQWNIDNKQHTIQEETQQKPNSIFQIPIRDCIKFKTALYELRFIFHYDIVDEWNYDLDLPKYGIVLNKTPDDAKSLPIYANTYIYFQTMQERDDEYDRLETYFASQEGINIL